MPKGSPSPDSSSRLRRVSPLAQAVEVLQQSIEATGSGTCVQIDAADLLDQLLQRLELLQPQQQRVVSIRRAVLSRDRACCASHPKGTCRSATSCLLRRSHSSISRPTRSSWLTYRYLG